MAQSSTTLSKKTGVLITAIGSMAARAVITSLTKEAQFSLIGCDAYPREWQKNLSLLDGFYQVDLAKNQQYIDQLIQICRNEGIQYIIPLTDPEVDLLNQFRAVFDNLKICLCIPEKDSIELVRNKYSVFKFFNNKANVEVIPTYTFAELANRLLHFPIMAKPIAGRSSEGVFVAHSMDQITHTGINTDAYIFQPVIPGEVFTVDVISDRHGHDVSVVRKELIRTKNGAGLTVEIIDSSVLKRYSSEIVRLLKLTGCVNMEFIGNEHGYFLMDINPRFSAGIAFSIMAGYDFPVEHLKVFMNEHIRPCPEIDLGIYAKVYDEKKLNP